MATQATQLLGRCHAATDLVWREHAPGVGDLESPSGRVLMPAVTLDAAGEEYLGVTIRVVLVTRSRSRSY